jgi:hypothetical protein
MIVFTDRAPRVGFQIDAGDLTAVSRYSWSVPSGGYLCTTVGKRPAKRTVRLHEFLLGKAPAGLVWDHANGDRLDNRRSNIRAVSREKNGQNRRCLDTRNTSGGRGVSHSRRAAKPWSAFIGVHGKNRWIGRFASISEAVAARQKAESDLWKK